jgi:hypothetical protein
MVYEHEELCVQKQAEIVALNVRLGGKFCTQWLQILYTLCGEFVCYLTCNFVYIFSTV